MVHLTQDQVHRYLEKTLTRTERVLVSEHLSACEQCRTQVTLNPDFQRFAADGISALTGATGKRKAYRLPFRRLTGTERLASDMRLRLCPSVLADGQRNETMEPQRTISLESLGSLWRRAFTGKNWGLMTGAAAATAVLLVVVWLYQFPGERGGLLTIRDADKILKIGAHGIVGSYLSRSAESRQLNAELARMVNQGEITVPRAILALRDEPSRVHGSAPTNDLFNMQCPAGTAIDTATPVFQWGARSNATGYVVSITANDRTGREVARSEVIPASGAETSLYHWRLPENTPLERGETYRWHVIALVNDNGAHLTTNDEAGAKFSVLSKNESENLAALKANAGGSQLVTGLLDLQAGLLDDAEKQFDGLRLSENQTDEGKAFLEKMITKVKTLKDDL
jgi:hypothetical protein